MSTRIRYFQKRVIYNDLKFPDNYRYHHSPVPINFLLMQIPIRYLDNALDWIMQSILFQNSDRSLYIVVAVDVVRVYMSCLNQIL
jgi:hypothetical protein